MPSKPPRAIAFPDLPDDVRTTLLSGAVEKTYPADSVIFTAGSAANGMYVILEGRVRVLRGGGGRQHVIHEEGPGGTLGEVPLFEGGTYPATAVAASVTRCLRLDRDHVHAAIRRNPDIAIALLARLSKRVRTVVDQLDRRTAQGIRERLAQLILQRAPRDGAPFTLGATQQEVAEGLGTVRELVVRGLRELREEGIIENAGRGRFVVRDWKRLEERA